MHFDRFTRQDLAESTWRMVAQFAKAVRIRFPPRSRFITIVIELPEEHESDGIQFIEVEDWQLYEEYKEIPRSALDKQR